MNEEELVQGCKNNDEKAQKQLYERYSRVMMGVCLRYANRYDEAQDILQDGFIKVFRKMGSFAGKGSLEGWIRRIMVNTALDYLRSTKAEKMNVAMEDVDFKLSDGSVILESMEAAYLLKIVQTLPKGYRTVFNLYAIEGYNHREIAEALQISENTSKSQYSRARSLLQKKLEEIDINFAS